MHWRDGAVSLALIALLWAAAAPVAAADGIPGDANCDGVVDSVDMEALVLEFFRPPTCSGADVNGDGVVNGADVLALTVLLSEPEEPTPTATLEPTPTATSAPGPRVVFFGLAGADGQKIEPVTTREDGVVIFQRPTGLGFKLVVEGAPGPNGIPVGSRVFVRGGRPDLQIQSTSTLGDGSPQVCITGVPAIDPPTFEPGEAIDAALNDLACNFVAAVNPVSTCTLDEFLRNNFLSEGARIQFCVLMDSILSVPTGETTFTVQLTDNSGVLGERKQILVRAGLPPLPTATNTAVPTDTRTPTVTRPPTVTPPATPTRTFTNSPTRTFSPTRTPTSTVTRTVTSTPTGSRPPTATATQTGTRTATGTRTGTATPESTNTRTPTATAPPTMTGTHIPSPTSTITLTVTRTPSFSSTPTRTRTPSPGPTSTNTPSPLPTSTLTRTTTPTRTSSRTLTPTITLSPTITRTITRTPTITRTITGSRPPTGTPTSTPPFTATFTLTGTSTRTSTTTRTPTRTSTTPPDATATATPLFSSTPTRTPLDSPTPTPTGTLTLTRTATRTRTPTLTVTGTLPATETPTRTGTVTRTGTATVTTTRSPTRTATTSPAPSETITRTPTRTPLPSASVTMTGTFTSTRTPSITVTPSRTLTPTLSPTVTRTATSQFSPTTTRTPTITRTPTTTRTATRTGTDTPLPTATRTRTFTRTPTPTSIPGPLMTFFGIANANGTLSQPSGSSAQGVPIYERPLGFGFIIVVEGRRGGDNSNVGSSSFNYDPDDAGARPDLQIIADRSLGNGSGEVCDNMPPDFGGVPAISPPNFDVTQPISDAINDFGCRFVDGSGNPGGRQANSACVLFPDGEYRFANQQSQIQFCSTVSRPMIFPKGDTLLTVRLRNAAGAIGETRQIIVRSQS